MTLETTGQRPTNRKEVTARYRKKNREKLAEVDRIYRSSPNGRARKMLSGARSRARKRGMDFELELEPIIEILEEGTCQLTGLPFVLDSDYYQWRHHPLAPSIDRIDSSRGYTKDNVQIVCFAVNALMGAYETPIVRVIAQAYLNATRGEYA